MSESTVWAGFHNSGTEAIMVRNCDRTSVYASILEFLRGDIVNIMPCTERGLLQVYDGSLAASPCLIL